MSHLYLLVPSSSSARTRHGHGHPATPLQLAYKKQRTHDAKPKLTQTHPNNTISSVHQSLPVSNMAKCLAVALLLLVVLASCEGRELNEKVAATRVVGAGGGVGESKALDLPVLGGIGTGTSTITGPLVVVPGIPAIGP
ncbi:uncharacterized protein LOC125534086 [Triticum urartu]|nr:uncharacterized protein LOC125534086 [Triticum urartu]